MFITGITEGDGCFYITIIKHSKTFTGWYVGISFTLVAAINPADFEMLNLINQ